MAFPEPTHYPLQREFIKSPQQNPFCSQTHQRSFLKEIHHNLFSTPKDNSPSYGGSFISNNPSTLLSPKSLVNGLSRLPKSSARFDSTKCLFSYGPDSHELAPVSNFTAKLGKGNLLTAVNSIKLFEQQYLMLAFRDTIKGTSQLALFDVLARDLTLIPFHGPSPITLLTALVVPEPNSDSSSDTKPMPFDSTSHIVILCHSQEGITSCVLHLSYNSSSQTIEPKEVFAFDLGVPSELKLTCLEAKFDSEQSLIIGLGTADGKVHLSSYTIGLGCTPSLHNHTVCDLPTLKTETSHCSEELNGKDIPVTWLNFFTHDDNITGGQNLFIMVGQGSVPFEPNLNSFSTQFTLARLSGDFSSLSVCFTVVPKQKIGSFLKASLSMNSKLQAELALAFWTGTDNPNVEVAISSLSLQNPIFEPHFKTFVHPPRKSIPLDMVFDAKFSIFKILYTQGESQHDVPIHSLDLIYSVVKTLNSRSDFVQRLTNLVSTGKLPESQLATRSKVGSFKCLTNSVLSCDTSYPSLDLVGISSFANFMDENIVDPCLKDLMYYYILLDFDQTSGNDFGRFYIPSSSKKLQMKGYWHLDCSNLIVGVNCIILSGLPPHSPKYILDLLVSAGHDTALSRYWQFLKKLNISVMPDEPYSVLNSLYRYDVNLARDFLMTFSSHPRQKLMYQTFFRMVLADISPSDSSCSSRLDYFLSRKLLIEEEGQLVSLIKSDEFHDSDGLIFRSKAFCFYVKYLICHHRSLEANKFYYDHEEIRLALGINEMPHRLCSTTSLFQRHASSVRGPALLPAQSHHSLSSSSEVSPSNNLPFFQSLCLRPSHISVSEHCSNSLSPLPMSGYTGSNAIDQKPSPAPSLFEVPTQPNVINFPQRISSNFTDINETEPVELSEDDGISIDSMLHTDDENSVFLVDNKINSKLVDIPNEDRIGSINKLSSSQSSSPAISRFSWSSRLIQPTVSKTHSEKNLSSEVQVDLQQSEPEENSNDVRLENSYSLVTLNSEPSDNDLDRSTIYKSSVKRTLSMLDHDSLNNTSLQKSKSTKLSPSCSPTATSELTLELNPCANLNGHTSWNSRLLQPTLPKTRSEKNLTTEVQIDLQQPESEENPNDSCLENSYSLVTLNLEPNDNELDSSTISKSSVKSTVSMLDDDSMSNALTQKSKSPQLSPPGSPTATELSHKINPGDDLNGDTSWNNRLLQPTISKTHSEKNLLTKAQVDLQQSESEENLSTDVQIDLQQPESEENPNDARLENSCSLVTLNSEPNDNDLDSSTIFTSSVKRTLSMLDDDSTNNVPTQRSKSPKLSPPGSPTATSDLSRKILPGANLNGRTPTAEVSAVSDYSIVSSPRQKLNKKVDSAVWPPLGERVASSPGNESQERFPKFVRMSSEGAPEFRSDLPLQPVSSIPKTVSDSPEPPKLSSPRRSARIASKKP